MNWENYIPTEEELEQAKALQDDVDAFRALMIKKHNLKDDELVINYHVTLWNEPISAIKKIRK
jgi:hypothetical protein